MEICGTYKGRCTDCPAFVKVDRSNCKQVLIGALDIINRQKAENEQMQKDGETLAISLLKAKAEIERLRAKVETRTQEKLELGRIYTQKFKTAKAEAYKEFAEKLYEELRIYGIKDKFNKAVFLNVVDKAKKELVGEDNFEQVDK